MEKKEKKSSKIEEKFQLKKQRSRINKLTLSSIPFVFSSFFNFYFPLRPEQNCLNNLCHFSDSFYHVDPLVSQCLSAIGLADKSFAVKANRKIHRMRETIE